MITGNAIAAALLEYTTLISEAETSVTVEITVLEENGKTSIHTLLLSSAAQFNVSEICETDGMTEEDEKLRFPVPRMPEVGISGKVESNGDARATAKEFNTMMGDIDDGLGQ